MRISIHTTLLYAALAAVLGSCSPKNISSKYYYENEKVLDRIEESYKELNNLAPFTIGFTDRSFSTLSLEIITDTLSYIYEFNLGDPGLADTLSKYHPKPAKVLNLVTLMQSIRCTWIRSLDYYVDEKKNSLIFMSIKPVALKAPLSYHKYYVLTYYQQPQYFDEEGMLLDNKRTVRRLRKINGEVFRKINDKVCYTISGNFR